MGLDKRASSQPGTVTVIFRVPPEAAASSAEVLGEFTDWVPLPMQPSDDGGHEATVDLAGGSAYRFRYRLDGERWMNDWSADDYVANEYGSDDSIVDLTALDFAPAAPEGAVPAADDGASRVSAPGGADGAANNDGAAKKTARKATKATKAQRGAGEKAAPAKRARPSTKQATAPKE